MNLHVQHPLSLTVFLWCLLDKPTSHGLVNSRTSHLANNKFLKNHGNTTTCTTTNNKTILKRTRSDFRGTGCSRSVVCASCTTYDKNVLVYIWKLNYTNPYRIHQTFLRVDHSGESTTWLTATPRDGLSVNCPITYSYEICQWRVDEVNTILQYLENTNPASNEISAASRTNTQ